MSDEIHSYSELQQKMHAALREQNPAWVEADGTSPRCDSYEARLAELIDLFESEAFAEAA